MLMAQSQGKITYYGTSLGHLERSFVPYVFPPTNFALTLFAEGQKVPPPLFPLPGRTEGKAKVITVAGSFLHESALPRSLRSNNRTRGSVYISSSRLTICPSSSGTTNAFAFSAARSFCLCQNYRIDCGLLRISEN